MISTTFIFKHYFTSSLRAYTYSDLKEEVYLFSKEDDQAVSKCGATPKHCQSWMSAFTLAERDWQKAIEHATVQVANGVLDCLIPQTGPITTSEAQRAKQYIEGAYARSHTLTWTREVVLQFSDYTELEKFSQSLARVSKHEFVLVEGDKSSFWTSV